MRIALGLILAAAALSLVNHVRSQTVPTPPASAIACAYNSSPPTVSSGQFVFAQCDATGKLVIAP